MCMKKTERPSTLPAKTIIIIGRVIASLLGLHFAFFSFFDWGPKNMRSYMLRLSTVKETWKYLNCIRNYNSPKWPHRSVFGNYIYWLSTGFRKRQGRVQFVCVIISNLRHAYCIFESLTLVLIRPFRFFLCSIFDPAKCTWSVPNIQRLPWLLWKARCLSSTNEIIIVTVNKLWLK